LSVLCIVLMGHWWHAVAMPVATAVHHDHTATAHHASADQACCDATHATHSVKPNCGGEHACCSLQPAPLTHTYLPGWGAVASQRHAVMRTLALDHPQDRLFKPPRAAL